MLETFLKWKWHLMFGGGLIVMTVLYIVAVATTGPYPVHAHVIMNLVLVALAVPEIYLIWRDTR